MSSATTILMHAIRKCSQKCLMQKVGRFDSLGLIPMIQSPFNSSCVALQYEPETKFFDQVVPELYDSEITVQLRGVSLLFREVFVDFAENFKQASVLGVSPSF